MSTLLIVEDNDLNRDMLSRRLERRGFTVIQAADGEQGVGLARSGNPEIVLMDLDLPVMDGWTATRLLKSDPRTAHLPVIALTAHAMAEDAGKAAAAGCDAYESKPVDLARLVRRIGQLLEKAATGPVETPDE